MLSQPHFVKPNTSLFFELHGSFIIFTHPHCAGTLGAHHPEHQGAQQVCHHRGIRQQQQRQQQCCWISCCRCCCWCVYWGAGGLLQAAIRCGAGWVGGCWGGGGARGSGRWDDVHQGRVGGRSWVAKGTGPTPRYARQAALPNSVGSSCSLHALAMTMQPAKKSSQPVPMSNVDARGCCCCCCCSTRCLVG